ncbi:hypothetical protein P7K49_033810 [Saguinus oedipus]|uniref:Uncharacterized protein n=1 Tax=Saguinus oedipus TaxID=9490 RepID=A0ABQ9TSZ3_SAGOE|nr:hypothetical protein P7K49_033810 [Saguinus oedipus]
MHIEPGPHVHIPGSLSSGDEEGMTVYAPNPVRNLHVKAQTNSSIALSWEAPRGPDGQGYTYWVECTGDGGRTETRNTTDTISNAVRSLSMQDWTNSSIASCWTAPQGPGQSPYTYWELEAGSLYNLTVWAKRNEISGYNSNLSAATEVIARAVVGILLFLILGGLLIFFLKRRNKKNQQKPELSDLVFSFPGDILAEDFADQVRKNEKDSNCGFAEEYQQLSLVGTSQSQMVASTPENNTENCYRNVLPYDWSRVPLKPIPEEPGSDYINASFMPIRPWLGLKGCPAGLER